MAVSEIIWSFVKAFAVGGIFCLIGQLLIDFTGLTPARILTAYVVAGVILGALGIYAPLAEWAGAGATIPLTGFGNVLAAGVKKAVAEKGLLGAFSGGFSAASAGICAAMFFGLLAAIFFRSGDKNK